MGKRWRFWVKAWWYRVRYGVEIGLRGSLLPHTGKGRYVSVRRRGPYIDVESHVPYPGGVPAGTVRVYPCQYNHGLFIECIGRGRTSIDYRALWLLANGGAELMDRYSVPEATQQEGR